MVKPCEICGDIGFTEAIRICCKCKISREHLYCMRIEIGGSEDWVCEDCESAKQMSSLKFVPNEQPKDIGSRFNNRKPPRNTKVQYISLEEAKELETAATKKISSSPSKATKREAVNCTTSLPKIGVKRNSQFQPPGFKLPLNNRSRPISVLGEKLSVFEDKETGMVQKQRICGESPAARVFPARKTQPLDFTTEETRPMRRNLQESPSTKLLPPGNFLKRKAEEDKINSEHHSPPLVQSLPVVSTDRESPASVCRKIPNSNAEKDAAKSRCASIREVHHSPAGISGSDVHANGPPKTCDPEGRESWGAKLELDRYLANHPARYPSWKGRFNVAIDCLQFRSFDAIQAYPSCKVHRKVYDMSKRLPNALQLDLLPRLNFWMDLFEDDVPGALDIGLYFLSSTRLEQSYTSLLEYLDGHDMLLRCQIDGVELLVFSSKHLQEDSQKMNQMFFLWGLFRDPDMTVVASGEQPSTKYEVDDMEIDMSGGSEILEKVDLVVPKPTKAESKDCDITSKEASTKRDLVVPKPTEAKPKDSDITWKEVSTKREADAVLELSPLERETPEVPRPWTMSCLPNQLEFARELQSSVDRFTKLMQSDPGPVVKVEVKQEHGCS